MRAGQARKVWFRMKIGGTQWTVKFAKLPATAEGLCIYEDAVIKLSSKLGRTRVYDVLWHELNHATMYMCGADHALYKAADLDASTGHEVEEVIAHTHGQAMFQLLIEAGWLRLPELPEWFDGK